MKQLKHKIICGNCVDVMEEMEPNSIDLTVTSPPYDNLRDYNGYEFDFESIANQLFRVTKEGGVVVWVVSDATIDGSESCTSFTQALYFKEIGFKLHDTMIWIKDGGGAIGSSKSYTQNFEYMFVFVNGLIKTHNLINDKINLSCGIDKSGVGRRDATGKHKIEQRKISGTFSKRNNYWYVPPQKGQHPAIFPEQLAQDHIITWSNKGDTVLDPLCGSGTTQVMAELLERNSIGIDISEKYCNDAYKRLIKNTRQLKIDRLPPIIERVNF